MKVFFYVSNALDDATRIERGITTDSPAASRKIFQICRSLKEVGIRPVVLSMGRGRQDGSWRYFPRKVKRVNGIIVIYLPFINAPILSQLLSLLSLTLTLTVLRRFGPRRKDKTLLFYNRVPGYLLGLALARLLRLKTVLDLEDGEIGVGTPSRTIRLFKRTFDFLCSDGAVLACSALEQGTRLRPTICCYGTSESAGKMPNREIPLRVLLGGTVSPATGGPLLAEAIRILRESSPRWAADIRFEISGKGESLELFQQLARDSNNPAVTVHGRMDDEKYRVLLNSIHVGLALKPISGSLAHTTFPSKVIELASQGILVLSTDISDVRKVLAEGALYLTRDDPGQLIDHLRWIVENRNQAEALAAIGTRRVDEICSPEKVGRSLGNFLFQGCEVAAA